MHPSPRYHRSVTVAGTLVTTALLAWSPLAVSDFALDWSAGSANPTFPGGLAADRIVHGAQERGDQTPFLYERVTIGGLPYYHMIIGDGIDPDDASMPTVENFGQEVYIQISGDMNHGDSFGQIGADGSASGGESPEANDPVITGVAGNHRHPLNQAIETSGNTTGNPRRVVMRQTVTDGEMSQEFLKDELLEKPTITNEITTDTLHALVRIDASGLLYDDGDTPASVINTLTITDPEIPEESATFDLAIDAQISSVTAGRYIYEPGGGPQGSSGAYTYTDDTGASLTPDWSSFFDHREANPWAYGGNRPVE